MLRANAVDERYLTSYTAYRTSGGLAPGGELRHAASGSEMCFCIHPRSASAHVRTPPISGAHFSPLYCTTGYHHNTQHTQQNQTNTPWTTKHQQQKTQPQHKPPKPNQNTQQNTTRTKKDASPRRGKKREGEKKGRGKKKGEEGERGEEEEKKGEEEERGGKGEEERRKKKPAASPTGNRTPVTRVTGGYTDHYTIEEEAMSEQASQTE